MLNEIEINIVLYELMKTFRGCNFLPGPIPQCLKLIIIILQIQIRFAKFSLNVNVMS